jgi:hypothetical protein
MGGRIEDPTRGLASSHVDWWMGGLLTKILGMQDAGQRTRARFCPRLARSASNRNRRLPENPFTRHPGQKDGSLQLSNTTKCINSLKRQKEQRLDDCEIRTHAPKDRGIGD